MLFPDKWDSMTHCFKDTLKAHSLKKNQNASVLLMTSSYFAWVGWSFIALD